MLDIANAPLPADTGEPLTFGVTEPFFTTVEVSAYGAFVLALPVILYQVYAFVLPAFSPAEKRTLTPFLIAMPMLFLAGVAFAYFVVMPVAVKFLLNFNEAEFNIQVRARDYYGFFGLMLIAMGLLFQMPIAMLSLTQLGVVDARVLRPQPPLRDLHHRGRLRRRARRRPGQHDHDHDPAALAVRGQHPGRAAASAARPGSGSEAEVSPGEAGS